MEGCSSTKVLAKACPDRGPKRSGRRLGANILRMRRMLQMYDGACDAPTRDIPGRASGRAENQAALARAPALGRAPRSGRDDPGRRGPADRPAPYLDAGGP